MGETIGVGSLVRIRGGANQYVVLEVGTKRVRGRGTVPAYLIRLHQHPELSSNWVPATDIEAVTEGQPNG